MGIEWKVRRQNENAKTAKQAPDWTPVGPWRAAHIDNTKQINQADDYINHRLTLLRNPLRTLPAFTDSDLGMRIVLSRITKTRERGHLSFSCITS